MFFNVLRQKSEVPEKRIKAELSSNLTQSPPKSLKVTPDGDKCDLEVLLSVATAKEREVKRINEEIYDLLSTPTVMVCAGIFG